MAVFFLAFDMARFSSKYFFLGLFLRFVSTQLFLAASLFLVLSVAAFCYGDFF